MTIRNLKIMDLVVSTVLVGGAIAGCCLTKLGAIEVAYFVPYVAWEVGCFIYAKRKLL